MRLESLFISSVSAVVLPVPHLVLSYALGNLHVAGVAGREAPLNPKPISVLIVLIVVAPLVAGLRKVQLRPSALGSNRLTSFNLTDPSAIAVLRTLAGAGVVAAPLLVPVAAFALSCLLNASISAPPCISR